MADPTDIAGLKWWWDFSDISTLWQDDASMAVPVTATGQPIGYVNDKSPNNNNVESTGSARPLYTTAAINGLAAARLDGTNDSLEGSMVADTSWTMFLVARKRSAPTTTVRSLFSGGPGTVSDAQLATHSTTSPDGYVWGRSGVAFVPIGGTATDASIIVLQVVSAASMTGYVNGQPGTTFDPEDEVVGLTSFNLGARIDFVGYGDYDLGEVIAYDSALSDADMDTVGEYLADKWGVAWSPPTYFGRSVNPVDNGSLVNSKVTVVPPASMLPGDLVYLIGMLRDTAGTGASTFVLSNCAGQDWAPIGGTLDGFGCSAQRWWCTFTGTWGGNLLTANQASLETDTTGWAVETNCTIARTSAGGAFDGTFALSLTSSAAGTMNARTPIGLSGIPVIPGTRYTAMAHFKAAVTGRTVRIRATFYDSAGAGTVSFSNTATDTTGGFTKADVAPVVPEGSFFVSVQVSVEGVAAAGEVHYVDGVSFAVGGFGGGTDWYPPSAIDPVINAQQSDAFIGAMLVFRPGSAGTHWIMQDQDSAFPQDVSAPYDLLFPSQVVPSDNEVIIVEWHDDILHVMALQTAGWSNPSGETQWRNTGGSDALLSIAYKIQSGGNSGDVVNRADSSASMGATYVAFTQVEVIVTEFEGWGIPIFS